MFAQIYVCPKHGETWHVENGMSIDGENDEVYEYPVCSLCGSEVSELKKDGVPVMHVLTEEEMALEMELGALDELGVEWSGSEG